MLPEKLVFVDLETTGLHVLRDRIIEIGILRVENNRLIDTYQTLINPDMYISPLIESITGIAKDDLLHAPPFEEVNRKIRDMLDDAVFVAHNVRFDYGFLKNEFKRVGFSFAAKQFCTARLSRKLYPKFRHHNLDSIIERYNISCVKRHRAFDDAQVLWKFYQILQTTVPADTLETALSINLKRPSLPQHISGYQIDALPESSGVYTFYGEGNAVLYVGKSKNVRNRVLSHFSSDHQSSKEMQLCQQIKKVAAIKTGGELGALLKESTLIKQLQPIYNRLLRNSRKLILLKKTVTIDGYFAPVQQTVLKITPADLTDLIGIFKSQRHVKEFLITHTKNHRLCEKMTGLEKTGGSCFSYKLHACKGACIQEEIPVAYNIRFLEAFYKNPIKKWPFPGPILITEKNELEDIEESFLFDKWCYLGYLAKHDNSYINKEKDIIFDVDIYKILTRFLSNTMNQQFISPLPVHQMSSFR